MCFIPGNTVKLLQVLLKTSVISFSPLYQQPQTVELTVLRVCVYAQWMYKSDYSDVVGKWQVSSNNLNIFFCNGAMGE